MAKQVVGVLVMAYGTPDRLEDILPYYTHIRRGRAPTPEQLEELTDRYRAIGGPSNLNVITRAQAHGIDRFLHESGDEGIEYRTFTANKHWKPWIPDVIERMAQEGIRRIVALVMAPQGSQMSSGAYFQQVDQAVAERPESIAVVRVFSWHLEPGFIQAQAEKLQEALCKFPEVPKERLAVVFTAHSLPERILTWQDPYPTHLREIGQVLAATVGLHNVHFAYQSAGRTPEPWLGPDIREKIVELAQAGESSVLVCPVGFISDHLEVLYDLDIEGKQAAAKVGVHLERTEMLNDHPLLLKSLADVVRRHAANGLS